VSRFISLLGFSSVIVLSGSNVWAEGTRPSGGLMMVVPWIAILGIFYFLLIRPQQKQAKEHQKLINNLKRGDRVLTQGGLYGTVQAVKGKAIEIKLNETTKVHLERSYVAKVVEGDPTVLEPEIVSEGSK